MEKLFWGIPLGSWIGAASLCILLVRLAYGARRNDLGRIDRAFESINLQLEAIRNSIGKFEDRLIIIEQWRLSVDRMIAEKDSIHREISANLSAIREEMAALRVLEEAHHGQKIR